MLLHTVNVRRPGLSLLEVIVATAIFLLSLAGLRQLISVAADQAMDVEMRSQAARLCHSKMAEVQAGLLPLITASETFEEDPDYTWNVDVESASIDNLWLVTVRVSRL